MTKPAIAVVGIDLGKNICSLAGLDTSGAVVLRRKIKREGVIAFTAALPACVIAMEACCGAHFLGRAVATGATSYNVDATTSSGGGAGTTSGQFGSGLGVAAGSSNVGVIGPTAWYATSTIKLTAVGGSFTGGSVRVAIQYILCGTPTS